MGAVLNAALGKEIAEALGLDPQLTTNIAITCEGKRPVSVNVTMWVTGEQGERLKSVFKDYTLVKD